MAKAKKGKKKKGAPEPRRGWGLSALFLLLVTFTGGFLVALELQKGDPFQVSRWLKPDTPAVESQPELPAEPPPPPQVERPVAESRPVTPEATPEARPAPPKVERPQPQATPVAVETPVEVAVQQPAPVPTPAQLPKEGRLAIVIDDCGYADNQGFISFEAPLTLAVLPHVPHSRRVAEQAVAQGKEVILHLPMEPTGKSDPGPGALTTDMKPDALREQVSANFEAVPGVSGLNNHQGSKASADEKLMGAVLDEAKRRGLYYLDSRTTNATVAPELAPKLGVPLYSRDIFLDNVDDVESIIAQLRRAEEVAKIKGTRRDRTSPRQHPRSDPTMAARSPGRGRFSGTIEVGGPPCC